MEIELEINGQKVRAKEGATIMQVAKQMGLYIPHFCWHPKLSIAANCRMCLVEVEKSPKPLPACATVALDGMVVRLDSRRAKDAQNSVMEFLLINHPLDCPICDQGGECQLQDLAVGYGVSQSRYAEEKRVVMEKNLGPLISTDMTRCIHCTRCVRFGREIGGIMELGMTGRGEHAEIMPFIERTVNSELSGNMIDVCPVGALTSKPFRFTARPWELSHADGLSPHDSWGANLSLHTKDGKIMRVVPRENDGINQCWISDRDRFSYAGLSAADRAQTPMVRAADARQFSDSGWRDSLDVVVRELRNRAPDKTAFLISPAATCEEMFLWQKIARGIGCENVDSRLRQRDFSAEAPSEFGFKISDLSRAGAVLLLGAEPAREQPLFATHFRAARRRLFSLGALDVESQLPLAVVRGGVFHLMGAKGIGGEVPLAAQQIARPSEIAARLRQINGILDSSRRRAETLFDEGAITEEIKTIAEKFSAPAKGEKHIILGDAVCGAEDFGDIFREAKILAENVGASLGTLSAGANGAGARRYGAFAREGGMSVGEMLHSSPDAAPDAVMLFGCEPRDFAERARAEEMLSAAGFVCAISPFNGGVRDFAHVMLPVAAFGENEGAFINGEGKMQRFSAVAAPPAESRPGWKVLRVLGDALGLDGFRFNTLDEVREMMKDAPQFAPRILPAQNENSENPPSSPSAETLEIVGGVAVYDSDMLVRRAAPLQKTARGKMAENIRMHPDDMAQRGIVDGATVILSDGESVSKTETRAFADETLARGAIVAYSAAAKLRSGRVFVASAEMPQIQKQAAG